MLQSQGAFPRGQAVGTLRHTRRLQHDAHHPLILCLDQRHVRKSDRFRHTSPLNRLLLDQLQVTPPPPLVSLRTDYIRFASSMFRVDKWVACSYLGTHSRFGNFNIAFSSHSHWPLSVETCMCSRHETAFFFIFFSDLFLLPTRECMGPNPKP